MLSEIRDLDPVVLNLDRCDIPDSVLVTMGQIINNNADTLLQLDLGENREIGNHFGELSQQITKQLSLTVLGLKWSLDPSDTNDLKNLLKKCPHIKQLNVNRCKCEISEDILKMKDLKEIDIGFTVDKGTRKGLDVGRVLSNLNKVETLEVFKADGCQIDDAQIQKIPFNKPLKIREMNLSWNRIGLEGREGLQYLCEHHEMLPELKVIWLDDNEIGDEGGQVLIEHLQHFKNMRNIWVGDNKMSENMKKSVKEKGNKLGIKCITDSDSDW